MKNRLIFVAGTAFLLCACGAGGTRGSRAEAKRPVTAAETSVAPATGRPVRYGYRIEKIYPHDERAYTQGLFWHDGRLWESTGGYGVSQLREVELESGRVLRRADLPHDWFGEGMALLDGKIYQLTWTEGICRVWDAATLRPLETYRYEGEGWGLTTDGTRLYLSDGTDRIRVIDPDGFRETGSIVVRAAGNRVRLLNELEWIDGEIWANVYLSDEVVRIDPQTGRVTGIVDFAGLLDASDRMPATDVFNGIAWDADGRRLFVTGKNWPKLFEVQLVESGNE